MIYYDLKGIYLVEPHGIKEEYRVVNILNFHVLAVCIDEENAKTALRLIRIESKWDGIWK